jgi:excinuclease ABC subunit C
MVRRPDVPIPTGPGVYLFRDAAGSVLYVGKAKSLRSRLGSYFTSGLASRTAAMVALADSVDWVLAESEVAALMLEYSLIKTHRPRFNIRLKDDKSYPYLAVTMHQEFPRPMVVRGRKRKGVRYFGPYAHAYAIRETLDLVLRTFPVRTCSDHKFRQHERLGRPCLAFHIERCAGPCVGRIDKAGHDELVAGLVAFLDGDHQPVIDRLHSEMRAAAEAQEYELAARLRDQLDAVLKASQRQQVVTERREDFDVVGLHGDELETAVHVFVVRAGRIVGQRGFIVDNVEDAAPEQVLAEVLLALYADADDVPRAVEVPYVPTDWTVLERLLSMRRAELAASAGDLAANVPSNPLALTEGDPGVSNYRAGRGRGGKVVVHVPQRGERKDLLTTVTRNAEESFVRHRLRRQSDHSARARALNELQSELGLPTAPLRIECFDISQVQGTNPVASMVVFEDGLARKDQYRRFAIRTVDGQDDFAMMREALTRRFNAYLAERDLPPSEGGRFRYPPGLLLIDGGRGQLNVALEVLTELGLDAEIPAAGLAKRFEEVYLPGSVEPLRLARTSEALYLLQRVRDEAHRFAVTYHRQRRGKAMVASALDGIPGLGPARRKALLDAFGSVTRLRDATEAELAAVKGVPPAVAAAVWAALHEEVSTT